MTFTSINVAGLFVYVSMFARLIIINYTTLPSSIVNSSQSAEVNHEIMKLVEDEEQLSNTFHDLSLFFHFCTFKVFSGSSVTRSSVVDGKANLP